MSASVGEGSGQDVELNLAPIIDCFTVLITYLLVTASFLTFAAVEVGVSATGTNTTATPDTGPPPLVMSLEIKVGGDVVLHLRGGSLKDELTIPVAAAAGVWNKEALETQLLSLQEKYPTLTEVSVSADPAVIYKDIVSIIHDVQSILPKVYISG